MKNDDLKNTYNKIAKDWNGDHIIDTWWYESADKFLSLLPQNASILDVGCAGGYKTNYIKNKGFEIEGIDFSDGMISDAKEKFPGINFKVFDVYDLDNWDKTYDGIFCQAVLLHIPKDDILIILEKMKNKLRDGGLMHIAIKEIRENKTEEEIKKENDYGYEYERFFSYYSLEELKKYFKELKMEIVYENIIKTGRSNWVNIIAKK